MSDPKFNKTAEYLHSGEARTLRAETSASVKDGLFMRIDADGPNAFRDTGQALNFNRREVVEFRDFLTEWLVATPERILPEAIGSRILSGPTGLQYIRVGENAWVPVGARRAAPGTTKTDLYVDSDFGDRWTLVKGAS